MNDIHVSKDNIPAFQANWQEAVEICRKWGISEIAVGGDLFFSRAAQTLDVLLAVHDALWKPHVRASMSRSPRGIMTS